MLALFGNLAPMELLLIAVVAILVFGGRLPEVAGRTFAQLRRFRRSLDDMRRETGIDREFRDIRRAYDASIRDKGKEAAGRPVPSTPPLLGSTTREDAGRPEGPADAPKPPNDPQPPDPVAGAGEEEPQGEPKRPGDSEPRE